MWSIYDLGAIKMLATIELGGLDFQALVGQGRVNQSSTANVDASDVLQASWRGITGLWGNVWQYVDGVLGTNGKWYVWQYNIPGNYTTTDYTTGYINTNISISMTTSGYPTAFDLNMIARYSMFVATSVNSTNINNLTGDYWYSWASDSVIHCWHTGGRYDNGADAGLFFTSVYGDTGNAYTWIGTRLAKT
jgi:hypothetical protein